MTSLLEIIMRSKALARKFNQGEYALFIHQGTLWGKKIRDDLS